MSTRCGNLDRLNSRGQGGGQGGAEERGRGGGGAGEGNEFEMYNLPPLDPRLARIHAVNMALERQLAAAAAGAARVNPIPRAANAQQNNAVDPLIDLNELDRELQDLQAPPPPAQAMANPLVFRQGLANSIADRRGR